MKHLRVVRLYFSNSFQGMITHPIGFLIFFFSKITRYSLFIAFLIFLTRSISNVGGFTSSQILIFYLTFNLIDTIGQMLFREVYRFRQLIVSGDFDMVLAKPFPPLLRVLVGGPDFIDMGILLILISVMCYYFLFVVHPSLSLILLYLLLIVNSLVISTAFHILILAVGILTTSIDHLVMIYRDITALMRIPVDFFPGSLRMLFTFVIPIGIMFTFPAKALMGLLSPQNMLLSLVVAFVFCYLSFTLWKFALSRYSSAGS